MQRGHHSSPSYTAFQLMEQIFECLKTQETEGARLPSPSPGHRRQRRSPRPSSPGFPLSCPPPLLPSPGRPLSPRGQVRSRSPTAAAIPGAGAGAERPPPFRESPDRRPRSAAADGDYFEDVLLGGGAGTPAGRVVRGQGGRGEGSLVASAASEGVRFFSSGEGGSSEEDFLPHGEQAGEGRQQGGAVGARFSTEWAYRLAVTKLTAQLKAARERLRGEKEASRLAGERADQVSKAAGRCVRLAQAGGVP